MSSSAGQKVTTDPATQLSPKNEEPGTVLSDSLAAESLQAGGAFAETSQNRVASAQPSRSTTTNTTDSSNATKLEPATSASTRGDRTDEVKLGQSVPGNSTVGSGQSETTADVVTSKPKGQNLHEGGFDSGAPNASFGGDIGGKDDPGRVALNALQEKNVPSAGGTGPRETQITNDGQFDALGETSA